MARAGLVSLDDHAAAPAGFARPLALTETGSEACGYLCEKPYAQSSYVCALVHYVRAPQLHDALRPRAPPSRDDAQLDDDDDDERRLSDDAPAPDASVISPCEFLPCLVI